MINLPPCYPRLAETAGLTVIPVPCDRDGLRADHLACSGARVVLVTPAQLFRVQGRDRADGVIHEYRLVA